MTIAGYLPPLPNSPAPPMAPIQSFDILELALAKHRIIESGKRLRYERSPSSSPRGIACDENLFSLLPDEVLEKIFAHCHLLDRVALSHVCYRFHYLLTNGISISDLSLFNISEKSVWTSKALNCTKSRYPLIAAPFVHSGGCRLSPIEMSDRILVNTVLRHCRLNENINIWYENLSFVEDVYYNLSKHRVKFRKIAIYPHCKVIGLDILHRYLPQISCLSVHPHGEQFAQEKVHLEKLPVFHRLSELSLSSVTIGQFFVLPAALTKLDFRNGNFDGILPQIGHLPHLRSLSIGNHEFSSSQFSQLCHAIAKTSLETLIFKFCHFDGPQIENANWPRLREFRLEQCYGPLSTIVQRILSLYRETLKVVGINVQSNDSDLSIGEIYALSKRFGVGGCDAQLDLTLFQKRQQIERTENVPVAPPSFANALCRLEISLIGEKALMDNLFAGQCFPHLLEIKAVECTALSDQVLDRISQICPNLQRISINECKHVTVIGISHFLDNVVHRRSNELIIEWKSSRIQLSDYFKALKDDQRVIGKLGVWYYSKHFNDENDGERIFVWEKAGVRTLSIQNYTNEIEGRQTLGIVVP